MMRRCTSDRVLSFLCFLALTLISVPGRPLAQDIPCGSSYIVVQGDTLGAISNRAYGPGRIPDLYAANAATIGRNINLIEIGMVLTIPCFGDTAESVEANFDPAPDLEAGAQEDLASVEIVFNKSSAPRFIMNVGIIDPFLAEITRVTDGRVTFVEPDEVNREGRAQFELVRSGEVGGAYVFNGYIAKRNPLIQITMQPMMGGSAVETAVALWRTHVAHFAEAENFADVQLLGFVGAPPAHIWRVSEAPVTDEEKLVGNNAWPVPYFEGLDTRGAAAVRAEAAERIRLLDEAQSGEPPTYALAHGAARAVGVWTEARRVTEIDGGVYAPAFSVVFNKDVWERISPQDRQAILTLSGEALALRSSKWDDFDNGHKAEMLASGLELVPAAPELLAELQDNARASWEEWIESADAEGISGFQSARFFTEQIEAAKARLRPQG